LGDPGEPEVLLWPLDLQVHSTVSPRWIITGLGKKAKKPMSPTVTVTVAALVTVGQKSRNGAIITTVAVMRSKEVFIILIIELCRER
jgi:hypothetical protein